MRDMRDMCRRISLYITICFRSVTFFNSSLIIRLADVARVPNEEFINDIARYFCFV